jgi:hypothetical protein
MIRATFARPLTALLVLVVALVLSGCGLVSLGYPRLPDLGLMWLQRQVDLKPEQAEQWRQDLQGVLAWHSRTQLTTTADLLARWQTLVTTDLGTDDICREADAVRRLVDATAPQLLPAMVRLARSLDAEQRAALAVSQQERLAEFRQQHMGESTPKVSWWPRAQAATPALPTPASSAATPSTDASLPMAARSASLNQRLEQAVDRYEMLYGRLSPAQVQALKASLEQSSFDARRLLAERERRSQDLLKALADTAKAPAGAEAQALTGWLARLSTSPTPGYAAYGRLLQQEGCTQMATLHRLATPAQRQAAASTLASYETDLRRLARP